MKVISTSIPDVLIIEPDVFGDERGFFLESYSKKKFEEATGIQCDFVQDNHSKSAKGILRGLHYQIRHPQGKLVRVVAGEVFDVNVDIRKSSDTFGEWVGVRLSAKNHRQLWVPEGFAHGFLALETEGNWYHRRAHEWRLTTKPMQKPKGKEMATNDWHRWQPPKTKHGSETDPSGFSVVPFENPKRRSGSN